MPSRKSNSSSLKRNPLEPTKNALSTLLIAAKSGDLTLLRIILKTPLPPSVVKKALIVATKNQQSKIAELLKEDTRTN